MAWDIESGPTEVAPTGDNSRVVFVLVRDERRREVYVELSSALLACEPETLPSPLDDAVRTGGRTLIARFVNDDTPPRTIKVHSRGWTVEEALA